MCDRKGAVRQENLVLAVWHWQVFFEILRNQCVLRRIFFFPPLRLTNQNEPFEQKNARNPGARGVNENLNHKERVLVWGKLAGKRKQK